VRQLIGQHLPIIDFAPTFGAFADQLADVGCAEDHADHAEQGQQAVAGTIFWVDNRKGFRFAAGRTGQFTDQPDEQPIQDRAPHWGRVGNFRDVSSRRIHRLTSV
jgi:hypothetical protein